MSLGNPLSRESFSLHRMQKVWTLLLRPAFGRGRGRSLEPVKLLQGVGLKGGGRAIVCFMSQVVLNAVEADTAGGALVVVTKRQGRENTATAVPWDLSQTGSLAEVNRAISFWTRTTCTAGRNFLLHCQAQNGGRRGSGGSSSSSIG